MDFAQDERRYRQTLTDRERDVFDHMDTMGRVLAVEMWVEVVGLRVVKDT